MQAGRVHPYPNRVSVAAANQRQKRLAIGGGGKHRWVALSRYRITALALCLFCLVVGARWALYYRYGTDLPELDQWDAEGLVIFFPVSIGQFHFSGFYWPHNEHRVALTRLIAYGLTYSNGQWDQRLEAVVNALFAGGIALFWWLEAARRLRRGWQIAAFALIAALYALPVAWENILFGFASSQFLLIGLALMALKSVPFARAGSGFWWVGIGCLLLSLGSMASGFFVAVIVLGMLVWQVLRGRRGYGSIVAGAAFCVVAIATGVLSRNVVPSTEILKAQSVGDFLLTAAKALGWPTYDLTGVWAPLVLFLPWASVAWRTVAERKDASCQLWNEFLTGAGAWVLLQVLAMAYARGSGGPSPASRYIDTLVVGVLVNLGCLASICAERRFWQPFKSSWMLAGLWGGSVSAGVALGAYGSYHDAVPPVLMYHRDCEQNVRSYLATHDEAYLQPGLIPYPDAKALKRDLDIKGIADLLPVSVRVPLALNETHSGSASGSGFAREDSRRPLSLQGPPRQGAGLPPAMPVLTNAVTWGSFESAGEHRPAQWVSQPVHGVSGQWLKFELGGGFNDPGVHLELRSAADGRVLGTVRPDKAPGLTWRSAYVPAPREDFVIAASDQSLTSWMAFSEPATMGWESYWAWRAVRTGNDLAIVALIAAGGLLIWLGVDRSVPKKSLASPPA